MKNKIKRKIINTAAAVFKLVRAWFTQPATVSWVRPFKRDIHLNSVKAISSWLITTDRPIVLAHSDTIQAGVGAGSEEKD